jgi:hypothetical protein
MEDAGMDQQRDAACPRCGRVFGCGAGAGECWCQELPPAMALADGDCLCPACLAEAIERASSTDPLIPAKAGTQDK